MLQSTVASEVFLGVLKLLFSIVLNTVMLDKNFKKVSVDSMIQILMWASQIATSVCC